MKFTYMKTPLHRLTFSVVKIREWVEKECEGRTLNLFAGETKLNIAKEIRNDIRKEMPAQFHLEALEFVKKAIKSKVKFQTIILDPPYSYRKSMEMYDGAKASSFNILKGYLPEILEKNGKVITFGYHSVCMGEKRGFFQEHLMVMYHGGAIHDTLVIVERRK